ncbi:MAG: hypothetical protein ISN29_08870 [Gammaproteobacteria bacterium AqS3]|nr:hypothetical protein [Gammaproteobacteria bacterium AqS3]
MRRQVIHFLTGALLLFPGAVWGQAAEAEVKAESEVAPAAAQAAAGGDEDQAQASEDDNRKDESEPPPPQTLNELIYATNRAAAVQDWKEAEEILQNWARPEDVSEDENSLTVERIRMRLARDAGDSERALLHGRNLLENSAIGFDLLVQLPKEFTALNARTEAQKAARLAERKVSRGGGLWTGPNWLRVALAHYEALSVSGTSRALDYAARLKPDSELALAIGRTYMRIGANSKGLELLREVDPTGFDTETLKLLGDLLTQMGDIHGALRVLQRAAVQNPKAMVWSNIATAYSQIQQHEQALQAYNRALGQSREPGLWVQKAATHRLLEQHDAAVDAYLNLLRLVTGTACYCVSNGYQSMFNPAASLITTIRNDPGNTVVQQLTIGLLDSLIKRDHLDAVLAVLLIGLGTDAKVATQGTDVLLQIYRKGGIYVQMMERVRNAQPELAPRLAAYIERIEEVVKLRSKARKKAGGGEADIETDRKNAGASGPDQLLQETRRALGHTLRAHIEADPNDSYLARILLASIDFENEPKQARKLIELAQRAEPDRLLGALMLDILLIRKNDFTRRARFWLTSEARLPDAVSEKLLMARAHNIRFKYNEAIELYGELLELQPYNPAHWIELAQLYSHTNRTEQLNVLYAQMAQRFPHIAEAISSLMVFGMR